MSMYTDNTLCLAVADGSTGSVPVGIIEISDNDLDLGSGGGSCKNCVVKYRLNGKLKSVSGEEVNF